MRMSVFFISGIDTDIGKTVAVGAMARYLLSQGRRVITVKMIQTGNEGFSEDLQKHRAMMGVGLLPEDREGLTAPQILPFPASPHLAAKLAGRPVDLAAISSAVATLAQRYEVVLVEGAGGLAVPLTEDVLTVDFAAGQHWPMILVSSGRLGSLNHSIQAMEMAAARKLNIVGTVYNWCPQGDPTICADSRRMIGVFLGRYGHRQVVVDLPEIRGGGDGVASVVDFSPIFGACDDGD
ncbi:MAG: ATP-dependent dethiobiotin synthetase BioD [Lentisphaerae bacterium]|jgi:dethiobiotin synthetase|nr:ATP-dependent dethiobiotin synthetase BioD [Lentisphaerota bacterium]